MPPSLDSLLRRAGFKIESRPKKGEVLWRSKSGTVHTQRNALILARRMVKS